MQTAKEEVIDLLNQLPDDSTLEEIQYHLYVRQKIHRGLKDVDQGKVLTQEEVENRVSILALIHGRRDFSQAWDERKR
jgi:plasmid stabilization system protein ParE